MNPFQEYLRYESRRQFLAHGVNVVGAAALATLLGQNRVSAQQGPQQQALPPSLAHFAGKAKHVIYLHTVGGPPQMDLYDYKPVMRNWYDRDLPDSVRMGQRLTTMTSGQARFP